MANRKTKPTSPGRRFGTYQLREELSGDGPTKSLIEGKKRSSGRNAAGRITSRHRGGGAKRLLPAHRLQAHQGRRARQGRDDRVRPQPQRLHRAAQLRRRREALHPRPAGAGGRRRGRLGRGRRHHTGQRAAARPDPDRHRRPQRRADARPGRPPRPRRRHRDPGGRQGGADGLAAAALLGGADGPRRVPRHGRLPDQRRAPEREVGQGRPQPPPQQAPPDPRRRHEPGGPPARRRRGPPHSRRPPGDPVGQADARLPDPQEGQEVRRADRPRPRRKKR